MYTLYCDESIPFAREAFENLGDVTICKGDRLTAADLKCVDALMIRSSTRVGPELLDGTRVCFVASATAGTDHVDRAYLNRRGIPFYHAPGCNAESVVEYVIAALLHLAWKYGEPLRGKCIGIVGAGQVGGRLARRLPALGLDVLVNDPPLCESMADPMPFEAVSLETLLEASDIISLHTPLTQEGAHPTYHLIDEAALKRMKAGSWLINAARGAVVSNEALKRALRQQHLGGVVLDVWEGEPDIDLDLLRLVDIGTQHIAGHSYEGKVNGTIQIYEAFTRHFGVDGGWDPQAILAPAPEDWLELSPPPPSLGETEALRHLVRQMYDIEAEDRAFRVLLDRPASERGAFFRRLRAGYPRRRTFQLHVLDCPPLDASREKAVREGLAIRRRA